MAASCFNCSNTDFGRITQLSTNVVSIASSGRTFMILPSTKIIFYFEIIDNMELQPGGGVSCSEFYGETYSRVCNGNCISVKEDSFTYDAPLSINKTVDLEGFLVTPSTNQGTNCSTLVYTRALIEEDTPRVGFLEDGQKVYFPPNIFKKINENFVWALYNKNGDQEFIENKKYIYFNNLRDIISIQAIAKNIKSKHLLIEKENTQSHLIK
ncbi:hypothetical protein MY04_3359 [Flammeovirga sp. MY04]|uniref:hypothetical protein n=1 Tax=Flammeovirga sp. MY04 TaxID=1191459 RepID=UPI00080632B6|nr:hypothetical protein [Flammeovirga sp. MY04]ANQ50721.1 hypothetical protein MY04_3359 [Flammeovirga sp. MY04]